MTTEDATTAIAVAAATKTLPSMRNISSLNFVTITIVVIPLVDRLPVR